MDVGRLASTPELSRRSGIAIDEGKFRMIEQVEEFDSKFGGQPLHDLEILKHRHIHVVEAWSRENVSAGRSKRADGRRNQYGAALSVAAKPIQ